MLLTMPVRSMCAEVVALEVGPVQHERSAAAQRECEDRIQPGRVEQGVLALHIRRRGRQCDEVAQREELALETSRLLAEIEDRIAQRLMAGGLAPETAEHGAWCFVKNCVEHYRAQQPV